MSRKSEKIFDGITQVGDDLIEAAQKPAKKNRVWTRWGAMAAVLAIAIGVFAFQWGKMSPVNSEEAPAEATRISETASVTDETPQVSLATYALAAAELPELAQRPQETAFTDKNGGIDWNAYSDAQQKWYNDCSAQTADTDVYRGKLDGFLTKSIPVFLDGEPGENRVYSPLNVYLALAMLTETTDGASRAQLLDLLGASDTAELREVAKTLWNANYLDDGVSTSLLSSSLWLNEDVEFVQSTMDLLAKDYHAASYRGAMGTKELNAALQAWLNENTGGLLKDRVGGIETDRDTLLMLLTAIYLKAPWAQEFSAERTAPETFRAKGGDLTCDFLHGAAEDVYYRGFRFGAAEKRLTLGVRGGSMWFLLPDEGVTPEELLQDGDVMRFLLTDKHAWLNENTPAWPDQINAEVRLSLPKFDVDSQTDLIPGLKQLGVTDAFASGVADFSPVIQNADELLPYIGEAQHAARVKVDEQGVEAAAFTEIAMECGATEPAEIVDFTLDRPFLFAITGADGLPLFVGIVNKPA